MHVFAHNGSRSGCGLQCAECKDFSVCAGSQVERGNLCNSDSTLEVFCWENREGGCIPSFMAPWKFQRSRERLRDTLPLILCGKREILKSWNPKQISRHDWTNVTVSRVTVPAEWSCLSWTTPELTKGAVPSEAAVRVVGEERAKEGATTGRTRPSSKSSNRTVGESPTFRRLTQWPNSQLCLKCRFVWFKVVLFNALFSWWCT